jgi:hypothetical protein
MKHAPFHPPEGFYANQRRKVLGAVRSHRRPWVAIAASVVVLFATGLWWTQAPTCITYACLLDATPVEELPLDWALDEFSDEEIWLNLSDESSLEF